MSEIPFHLRRRQQFLTESVYHATRKNQLELLEVEVENIQLSEVGSSEHQSSYLFLFLESLWIWLLDYTAGVDISILAPQVRNLVDKFEAWNEQFQFYLRVLDKRTASKRPNRYMAAPDFAILGDYANLLQLVSIAILVRDIDSVRRIAHIMRSHRKRDGLLEALLAPFEDPATEVTARCVIKTPYQHLLNVFFIQDDADAIRELNTYLSKWYPAMKPQMRWFDAHLRQKEGRFGAYYGYWAFEAAAACFVSNLDASELEHMVFPQDLFKFAMELRASNTFTSNKVFYNS